MTKNMTNVCELLEQELYGVVRCGTAADDDGRRRRSGRRRWIQLVNHLMMSIMIPSTAPNAEDEPSSLSPPSLEDLRAIPVNELYRRIAEAWCSSTTNQQQVVSNSRLRRVVECVFEWTGIPSDVANFLDVAPTLLVTKYIHTYYA